MRFAVVCLFAALPAFAADQWIRVATPHFEMYTDVGERSARDAILYFEELRSFFNEVAPVRGGVTEFPVRIIIFKNEKQYRPYAFNSVAAAYYMGTEWRDYIVMQDAETEHLSTAIHEYMHLIVRHSGLSLPLWLNEGWADVYSTLKPVGKKTTVGELIPGHVQELTSRKWLDFDTLTSVGQNSPSYNEANRVGIFYAESWALVHMLYLSPDYKQKFPAFVNAIVQGKTAAEACQIAFGRSSAQVYADLKAYLTRNQLYGVVFSVKLTKAEEEAEVTSASEFDSGMALADLLAANNKREQAQSAYERLAKLDPKNSEIPKSLGYLAWRNGDNEGARQRFEEAFAAGNEDPKMCFTLATMEQAGTKPGDKNDKIVQPLLRALKVRPDYVDARLELGIVELNAKNYDAALASFLQVHNVPAERAAMVFNGMAFAYAEKGDLAAARRQANNARKWDRTDAERRQTDDLIQYLDRMESRGNPQPAQVAEASRPASVADSSRPTIRRSISAAAAASPEPQPMPPREKTERVEGVAKNLVCSGTTARLQVLVGDKTMTFDMADPDRIVIKHDGAATFNFTCGAQKPFSIAIEYVPAENAKPESAGAIRRIEF